MNYKDIKAIRNLTMPPGGDPAELYLSYLASALTLPQPQRFLDPVTYIAHDNQQVVLTPASFYLRYIQQMLAGWISRTYPLAHDFSLESDGLVGALYQHQTAEMALVLSVRPTRTCITASVVAEMLKTQLPKRNRRLANQLAEFLTHENRLPLGCVSTPYVFGMRLNAFQQTLEDITTGMRLSISRYDTEMCISGSGFDAGKLGIRLVELAAEYDIVLENLRQYQGRIVWLGTRIENGRLTADTDTENFVMDILREVKLAPNSQLYRTKVAQVKDWVRAVYGDMAPEAVMNLLAIVDEQGGCKPCP